MIGEDHSSESEMDSLVARIRVEKAENWAARCRQMPFMRFDADWEVSVIPPFSGAIARFRVRKGEREVSVYADFFDRLGYFGEPHWEIYPDADGDNSRFALNDTDTMLAWVRNSLNKDGSDSRIDTRPPSEGEVEATDKTGDHQTASETASIQSEKGRG